MKPVSQPPPLTTDESRIALAELIRLFWRGRLIIGLTTVLGALCAVGFAMWQTPWYRAEVVLVAAGGQASPGIVEQLGGLAALAGVTPPGAGDTTEALATLRSREFARDFIADHDLLPLFFADRWDASAGRWQGDAPERWPDLRDGVRYFHDRILRVTQDRQTRLLTLAVEWTDPDTAAEWADALVARLNSRLRERALREAEANLAYLREELGQTSVISLQQSIARLLESEMQKLMLARGNEEFALRVIDPAEPPRRRVRPRRAAIVVLGTLLGAVLGAGIVLIRR